MLKRVLVILNIIALAVLALIGFDTWIQLRARQVTVAIISPLVRQPTQAPVPGPVPVPQETPPTQPPIRGRK